MMVVVQAFTVAALMAGALALGYALRDDGDGCNGHHWERHDLQPKTQLRTKSVAEYRNYDMELEKKVRQRCDDCGDKRDVWIRVGTFDHEDIEAIVE